MKKKMKIIDLYTKIANDELKNLTKFKYGDDYFEYFKYPKQIHRYTDNTYNKVEYYDDNLCDLTGFNDEVEIIEDEPKKWKIKDGRFVVDKVLKDGSVIIAEEDEKIEPINVNLDYIDFDLLFPVVSSKKFTHNELVIINKVNEMIKRLNKRR